jgi:hypothetical protein
MPNPTITTTYAGEFAGKYIAAALLSAPTLDKGLIEIKPNVKYKEVMKTFSNTDLVADASCDFTPVGDVTLAERVLTVKELQVNVELCKQPFRNDWEAVQMGFSAWDNLPPSFTDFLIAQVSAQVAQATEQSIWNGNGASAGQFTGILGQLAAITGFVPVTGTTVDATNVIDEIGKVVDAIPSTLYGKEDMTIYVPQNVAKAYVRALGGFAANGVGAQGVDNKGTMWWNQGDLNYDGVRIAMVNGLPSNKMVAAQKSNLFFGTGLLSDHNEVKLLDMSMLDGSDNVRVIMRYTAGTTVGIASDVVLYA